MLSSPPKGRVPMITEVTRRSGVINSELKILSIKWNWSGANPNQRCQIDKDKVNNRVEATTRSGPLFTKANKF